jgi:DNA-binding GntR family transcriptional regulator
MRSNPACTSDGVPVAQRKVKTIAEAGLTRQTASEAVAERLREEIQRGDLPPGTRLRQSEVAARFAVSTTPVREAFAWLQAHGLVRIDPHRGAIVFHPTTNDARELYEIRLTLETLAITHAIKNLSDEQIDALQSLLDDLSGNEGTDRWAQLHNRFHMTLYNSAGMPRLATMIANMRDASSSYINMFVTEPGNVQTSRHGHQAILDACKRRDVRAAKNAVIEHLKVTLDVLVASLEESDS